MHKRKRDTDAPAYAGLAVSYGFLGAAIACGLIGYVAPAIACWVACGGVALATIYNWLYNQ